MTEVYSNPPKNLITSSTKAKTNIREEHSKLAAEGIYIFGGLDSSGSYSNTLKIINTSTDPWSLYSLTALGQPPSARAHHCTHFLPSQSYLIIYGGKDLQDYQETGRATTGSIFVLDLTYMVWSSVRLMKREALSRYGFNSFVFGRFN